MKLTSRLFGALALCCAGFAPGAALAGASPIGQPHPALVLRPVTEESPVSIDSFRGQKIVVVHFAPWSPTSMDAFDTWVKKTEALRSAKKLALIGVLHEPCRDRARLYAQWKAPTVQVLHDPMNVSNADQVPLASAIDENGFVRLQNPDIATDERWAAFEKAFVRRKFKARRLDIRSPQIDPPDPRVLKRQAAESRSRSTKRELADALVLRGLPGDLDEALRIYSELLQNDASDAATFFRLGIGLSERDGSEGAGEQNEEKCLASLKNAVKLAPKNRVYAAQLTQLFGTREKLPPNTISARSWTKKACEEIRARGDTPVDVRPVR